MKRTTKVADPGPRQHIAWAVSQADHDALEERAAIIEFDGGLPRAVAEKEAVKIVSPTIIRAGLDGAIDLDDSRLDPFIEAMVDLLLDDLARRPPGR